MLCTFDFTNTYYIDNKRYVNKEYIRYDLLDELAYEFENRFADNLLYEASYKYKENLDKCLDGVYKDIEKTSKPSRYFKK